MQTAAGTIALIAGGVIIVAVGGYHVYKGANRTFLDDLKGKSSALVRRLGIVGYITKGLVIVGVGVLVVVAASRSDPNKATGLDGALKTLGAQPHGAALLIAAALASSPMACTASPWRDTPICKWLLRNKQYFRPRRPAQPWCHRLRVAREAGRTAHKSLHEGAAATDGVIHLAFKHDFDDFAVAGAPDLRAVETKGAPSRCTPVLYGEEIGMAENLSVLGRFAVSTPMQ